MLLISLVLSSCLPSQEAQPGPHAQAGVEDSVLANEGRSASLPSAPFEIFTVSGAHTKAEIAAWQAGLRFPSAVSTTMPLGSFSGFYSGGVNVVHGAFEKDPTGDPVASTACFELEEIDCEVWIPDVDAQTILGFGQTMDAAHTSQVSLGGAQILRAEYFGVRGEESDSFDAIVVLRRYLRAGVELLERDTIFKDGELFTSQHEQLKSSGSRLIWRELNLGHGVPHTLIAEGVGSPNPISILRHGNRSKTHDRLTEELDTGSSCTTPLALLESLRSPLAFHSSSSDLSLFLPQTASREAIRVRVVAANAWGSLQEQWVGLSSPVYVQVRTADARLQSEYRLQDSHVLGFRWRSRAPWAELISESTWEEKASAWRSLARPRVAPPHQRALEAAAPFLDKQERSRPMWWRQENL